MNFLHFIGRLSKDPETRFTSGGQKVTTLNVASNYFRSGNEETIWFRVTLWGDRWDKLLPHLTKGKPIMVGGEIRKPEIYTDKSGQPQVSSIDVTADYIKFLPYGKPEQGEGAGQNQAAAPQAQQEAISDAVFWRIISKYTGSAISNLLAFSICSNSPSLISRTAFETIPNNLKSLLFTDNKKPRESK